LGKFYTGITGDDLQSRIDKHNQHHYGTHRFTAKATDWELFLQINADSYAHSRRIELRIKKNEKLQFHQRT
jgi:putative endonuclease